MFVEQILNYRLLGNRLCEGRSQAGFLNSLINEVIQVLCFLFLSTSFGIQCRGFVNLLCDCAVGDILYMHVHHIPKDASYSFLDIDHHIPKDTSYSFLDSDLRNNPCAQLICQQNL